MASDEYNAWVSWVSDSSRPTDFLWYRGGPRVGKTATLACVVQKLREASEMNLAVDTIYAFCGSTGNNNPSDISGSGTLQSLKTLQSSSKVFHCSSETPRTFLGTFHDSGSETLGSSEAFQMSASQILRSFISQLVLSSIRRVQCLNDQDRELLRDAVSIKTEALPNKSLWSLLIALITAQPQRDIHLVIDGLDSIRPETDKILFTNKLRKMWDRLCAGQSRNFKLLVSSLPHTPIQQAFLHLPCIDPSTVAKGELPSHVYYPSKRCSFLIRMP